MMNFFYTFVALCAIGIMAAIAATAPRCTVKSHDGIRVGHMLVGGCDSKRLR